ncbi:MAG: hypothetical protein KJ578_04605 [Bacteroidetes bacterium]|nr:hypothetical protein [Bacteroidota bacterium]MBU1580488.1 hypothetical protein [Bacteroidota bacterium]MBU2557044.1 hypothetical protein [Bacteroidota bacterium]
MESLSYISPNPKSWHKIHGLLTQFWEEKLNKTVPKPPVPLILNGWVFSSDFEKKNRWLETLKWAEENNCSHLIPQLSEEDKYFG